MIETLLIEARTLCVAGLSALDGTIEPALRTADGAVAYDPEGLRTPVRKDVARKEADCWVTANIDAPAIRPSVPVQMIWKGTLRLTLQSVTWDYVHFRLSPHDAAVEWSVIRNWFLSWFDPEDAKEMTTENVYELVHFLSDPECSENAVVLTVDFGSAPIDAFYQLLDQFAAVGFATCEIT